MCWFRSTVIQASFMQAHVDVPGIAVKGPFLLALAPTHELTQQIAVMLEEAGMPAALTLTLP